MFKAWHVCERRARESVFLFFPFYNRITRLLCGAANYKITTARNAQKLRKRKVPNTILTSSILDLRCINTKKKKHPEFLCRDRLIFVTTSKPTRLKVSTRRKHAYVAGVNFNYVNTHPLPQSHWSTDARWSSWYMNIHRGAHLTPAGRPIAVYFRITCPRSETHEINPM